MKISENTPKIYVGTYGMYNSGSLFGKWFDLSDYTDAQEFFKDCYEYLRNEFFSSGCRPELMFQDWENIPAMLISKSNLHEDAFKYFEVLSEMDDDNSEAFQIYCTQIVSWPYNGNDLDETLEGFQESYQGYFGKSNDPKTDFAYQFAEDTGLPVGAPDMLERYFDYEAYGRDLFLEGYSEYEGYVFLFQKRISGSFLKLTFLLLMAFRVATLDKSYKYQSTKSSLTLFDLLIAFKIIKIEEIFIKKMYNIIFS